MLDFSKIEAGKVLLEDSRFSVSEVLQSVCDLYRYQSNQKSLSLELVVDPSFAKLTIVGDAGRYRQIVTNIVNNAIKFTPEGGSVKVLAMGHFNGENDLLLKTSVIDSGIGISADVAAKLFVPFTQADSSTSRSYGGTGLGLAICRNLCKLMNGKIWISPGAVSGAEFHFEIPFKVSKEVLESSTNQTVFTPMVLRSDLRILVAEDNIVNQRIAMRQLGKLGLRAEAVANGKEAVEACSRATFDIIFMDCHMPELDGYEASKQIKHRFANASGKTPSIIAMTANALVGDREKCLEAGMDDYLSKPTSIEKLHEKVLTWSK